jgi:selenocysteine-specific translation elongation factor
MHLTIGIFGDKELIKRLGKQGTVNDIALYNHGSSEGVFTFASPNSPENRIQPLLQVLSMIDVPVIAGPVTKEMAEQMIAIDSFGFEKGILISPSEDMVRLIKGTSLEKYEILQDERELREKLHGMKPKPIIDNPWLPIDNYFMVKSVGTVVLCVNKGCAVKKHEKLMVQPMSGGKASSDAFSPGREVLVKGIQSQDRDIEIIEEAMRAGVNLKGVDAEELKRGFVLCRDAQVSKSVKLRFQKSRFAKESPEKGIQYYLSVGLQVIAGKVESVSGEEISLSLEQPAVFFHGQKCMLASTKPVMPRVLGSGFMV